MKPPSHNKTGLAKTATVLAMILMISLGLCGANVFATFHFIPFDGSEAELAQHRAMNDLLTVTAYAEFLGIVGSLLGLVICGVIAVFKFLGSGEPPPSITKGDD